MKSATLSLCAALLTLAACAQPSASPASAPRTSISVDSTVYDISRVEVKPQLSNRRGVANALESNYPPELRNAGIGGRVTLRFTVEKDGRTSNIRVLGSENANLSAPATAVVRTMRFTPGMVAGAPVRTDVALPVTFNSGR